MPKGPRGEKRPGDVIGAAIMVAKIATGVRDALDDGRYRRADRSPHGQTREAWTLQEAA